MAGRRTTLGDWHEAHGARFVPLGEYEVPSVYESTEREYVAMRDVAAIIDQCHLCRFKITGTDREAYLDSIATRNVAEMPMNSFGTAYLCNERGGIVDEVMLFKTDKFLLVQGTTVRRQRLFQWLQQCKGQFEIDVTDSTVAQGAVELRGPQARRVIETSLLEGGLPKEPNTATIGQIGQARSLIIWMPMGSTERYQVHAGALYTQDLWDKLANTTLQLGGAAAGNEALELVRVEAGHPISGREIDEETTPLELGAAMRIDFQKKSFSGRRALLHSTCGEFGRRFICVRIEGDRPPAVPVGLEADGIPVGYLTSAVRSPAAGCVMGLGFVDTLKSAVGTAVEVAHEGGRVKASVVSAVTDVGVG